MNNHRITLSIDTTQDHDQLVEYLQRALKTFTWSALPHPHMRIAIESDAYELEVFDSRTKENK